jgi:DNA-binding PadR family transcriptional regulator
MALLYERPMHPYEMVSVMRERGKHESVRLRYGSLYSVVRALDREGFISPRETLREGRRPERTVYELTEEGRRTFREWMHEVLSAPVQEFPEFPAAVSLLALLEPEDALRQLEARVAALENEASRIDAQLGSAAAEGLPRLFLLEAEYQRAALEAELGWVRAVADDLRTGRLTWSDEWLRQFSEQPAAPYGEERGMT